MEADVPQYAIMRERMDTNHQELEEIVESTNRRQKGLLTTMERKRKLTSGALEEIRANII